MCAALNCSIVGDFTDLQ